MKKVLFPTDFSSSGDEALHYATSLARDWNAELILLHVEETPLAYGGGELYYGLPEPNRSDLRRMLEALRPDDPDVPYEHRLITGEPAAAIVDFAKKERADLIVMGTHGRSGFTRLLMGSVAEAVMRKAPCPVLTIKEPAGKAAAV